MQRKQEQAKKKREEETRNPRLELNRTESRFRFGSKHSHPLQFGSGSMETRIIDTPNIEYRRDAYTSVNISISVFILTRKSTSKIYIYTHNKNLIVQKEN